MSREGQNELISNFESHELVDDPVIAERLADGDAWQYFAACSKEDPELFFVEGQSAAAKDSRAEAIKICGRCVVRNICLDFAITTRQDHGIWGGLTADQRMELGRKIRRRS